MEAGAILYAEEYLHGKLHKHKFILTNVIPNHEFQYRVLPGVHGGFRFLENEKGVDFEAELQIGWDIPFVGTFIDMILTLLFSRNIKELRQHISEEGANLRTLLEQRKAANANIPNNEV